MSSAAAVGSACGHLFLRQQPTKEPTRTGDELARLFKLLSHRSIRFRAAAAAEDVKAVSARAVWTVPSEPDELMTIVVQRPHARSLVSSYSNASEYSLQLLSFVFLSACAGLAACCESES